MAESIEIVKSYLSDIPRFKNWEVSRYSKIDVLDFKGFMAVHPEKIKYQQEVFLVNGNAFVQQSSSNAFENIALKLMNYYKKNKSFDENHGGSIDGHKMALLYILFHLKKPLTIVENAAQAKRFNISDNIESPFMPPAFKITQDQLEINFWAYEASTDTSSYYQETLTRPAA